MKKNTCFAFHDQKINNNKIRKAILFQQKVLLQKVPNFQRAANAAQKKKRIVKYGSHCLKRSFHLWLHHSFIWFLICRFVIFRAAIIVFPYIFVLFFHRFSPRVAYGFGFQTFARSSTIWWAGKVEKSPRKTTSELN